jgi:hypothetical protein
MEKYAKLTPEGYIELVYDEHIKIFNQAQLLKLGTQIANDNNLLERGLDIIIDATKTKIFDKSAGVFTRIAAKNTKINHIAIFGTLQSVEIVRGVAETFGDMKKFMSYFYSREEAVNWLDSFKKDK